MLRISLTFSGKRNSVGGGPGLADHVEGNTPGWDHAEYRCRPSSCRGSITHPLPCFSLSRRERPQTRRRDGEHPASKCLENYRTAESSRADGTATALTFVLMSREVMSLTGAGWRPANMTLARSPSYEAGGPPFRDSTHLAVNGRHHPTQIDTTDVALFVALRGVGPGKCHNGLAVCGLRGGVWGSQRASIQPDYNAFLDVAAFLSWLRAKQTRLHQSALWRDRGMGPSRSAGRTSAQKHTRTRGSRW